MANLPQIVFTKPAPPKKGSVVFLMAKDGDLSEMAKQMDKSGQLQRAVKAADFSGKLNTSLELIAPEGGTGRWIVLGCGDLGEANEQQWMKLGGKLQALSAGGDECAVFTQVENTQLESDAVAAIAAGIKLRAYRFDKHKSKAKKDDKAHAKKFALLCNNPTTVRRSWKAFDATSDGVALARDLVNEPANYLTPVEFSVRVKALSKLGVKVQILTERELKSQKMGALLGVAQGSENPPRVAIMQWNGGKAKEQPLAFIGKGVTFDTGGISIKPSGGMEDMKGDMGGAAAVTGLIHALAARKAKANVVGIIGLVENMPDGKAQRPGDVVTSMSGQTIEIINTDAEGRLVLADILWYCQKRFKPKFMINLATLTGAIIVALGKNYAGMFSNNDELCNKLNAAAAATGEKVWRMPLDKDFDKMIDSKFADVKNAAGRYGGSCTAGQFLQRFVNEVPWAHLDIAGTAMGSPKHEFNQSWGSGYGVRLLDNLVRQFYE